MIEAEKDMMATLCTPNTCSSNSSMETHILKHMIGGKKRGTYVVVTQSLIHQTYNSMKLTFWSINMIGEEKRDTWLYSQSKTSNNSMKTHWLKHRHDRRRAKRYVVVAHCMPNTLNNSMKTHLLRQRHAWLEESKKIWLGGYTRSLIHQTIEWKLTC